MAHRLVKQSNGRYSIYSTIVDAFICFDATKEDLFEFYLNDFKEDLPRLIESKIKWAHDDSKETLQDIKLVHGKNSKEYKEALEFFKEE